MKLIDKLCLTCAFLVTCILTDACTTDGDDASQYQYSVEIDGTIIDDVLEIAGLSVHTEVVEYREGGDPPTVRKLPGITAFDNVVIKRHLGDSNELWDWYYSLIDPAGISLSDDRKDVLIEISDTEGNHIASFRLLDAWPAG